MQTKSLSNGRSIKVVVASSAALLGLAAGAPRRAMACEECQLRKEGLFLGKFTLLGNGTVRTWMQAGKNGKPSSLGVTFSETALSGLPDSAPGGMVGVEHNMALPPEAAVTGIDHVGLDWNPKGHDPKGIYDTPHFDIHFYLAPQAELNKITLKGSDLATCGKQPAARFMPPGYIIPPGTAVPRMGAHAIDAATPELHGKPFTQTFLYGFYNGKMNFVEPMVSKAFLETRTDLIAPIKQPAAFPHSGYYPTRYSVKYDAVRQEYTIALEGLTYRAGVSKVMVAAVRR